MYCQDMIDCIGRTPLVRLRLDEHAKGAVYAKLELQNPFGMKDRVAKQIILEAKQQGLLQDGAPIVESSSGTLALGVAFVGTYLGHEVHIVTDPRIDEVTLAKLRAMGCTLHIVPKMTAHGWQSARLERLHELLAQYPAAFWPRQYEHPGNPRAYHALARELLDDIGHVDILVASVGSGGSLCGTAGMLREHCPNLLTVAVDATGSVLFGQPDRPGRLQGGLGNSLVPPNVDRSVIDIVHWLNDEEAFAATLALASHENIFAGNSSGSVYAVARWLSRQVAPETKIVAIFPDRGDRYFATIYNKVFRTEKGMRTLSLPDMPQEIAPTEVATHWSFAHLKMRKTYAEKTLTFH